MEVIEEKVEAGGKEIEEKPKKALKPTKVIDLVKVLQQSLEQTGKGKKSALTKRAFSCSAGPRPVSTRFQMGEMAASAEKDRWRSR